MSRPGVPPAFEPLAALSPSATTPVWLDVARQQASRRSPADLLAQYAADRFVSPSAIDLKLSVRLDSLILEAADEFEAVLFSPLAPLGSCSVLGPTSQDRTISALRSLEVVSDPTNVMALECARRLRESPDRAVRLCTLHQVVRAQPAPRQPGFSQHFRMFAMAEAGLGRANDGFEVEAVVRQLSTFDRFFDAAHAVGLRFAQRRLIILSSPESETSMERIANALADALPHVAQERGALNSSYYSGLRVQFGASTQTGEFCPIGDLGAFDWMARLTANRKLRFVASGLGIQLAPLLFREPAAT